MQVLDIFYMVTLILLMVLDLAYVCQGGTWLGSCWHTTMHHKDLGVDDVSKGQVVEGTVEELHHSAPVDVVLVLHLILMIRHTFQ